MLAAPILLLFSLLVFRSLVAALLPLRVGTVTVLLTFSGLRIINEFEPMSTFAINLTTGLGLGLAIDYSLFMVSRFREELERRRDRARALRATMRTAGRTVLFSAFTVAAALAAMLVFPLRFLYSMGAGGVLVALSAALVSLTLLPALLAVLGPRVNALGLRRWQRRHAARRRARARRPLVPALARRHAPPGAGRRLRRRAADRARAAVPADRVHGRRRVRAAAERSAEVVDEALRSEFPPGPTAPVLVVAGPGSAGARRRRTTRAACAGRRRGRREPAREAGGYWLDRRRALRPGAVGPAKDVVRRVRAMDMPFPVQVGGETARFLDQQTSLADACRSRWRS